jgi:SAM-dependent methyltransferase
MKIVANIPAAKTKLETVNCLVCNSQRYEKLFDAPSDPVAEFGFFCVVKCKECGLVYTNPRPPQEQIGKYYGPAYYGPAHRRFIWPVEQLVALSRRRRIRAIRRFKKTGRILDIGCGRGEMLVLMRRMGWEVYGTELTAEAAEEARRTAGPNIREGELTQLGFSPEFFDCVTLWYVFEHVYDPRATTAEIFRILKPGGLLVIAVQNYGGRQARFGGPGWFHLDVPRHTVHFDRATLEALLSKHNFRIIHESHFSWAYDTFGWLQTLYNRAGFEHNLLYTMLRRRDWWQKVNWGKFLGAAGIALLLPVFLPISLALTIWDGRTKSNGTFIVYAFKNG